MKRTGCIVAAALLLGLLLAGITGYFIWHSGQDKYVRAEMVGALGGAGMNGGEAAVPGEAPNPGAVPDMGEAPDTGGAPYMGEASGPGEAGGAGISGNSPRGADGPDAMAGGLSANPNGAKEQGPGAGTEDEDSTLQLVFAGDILLSDHVLNAYRKAGNIGGVVDSGFRKVIDGSDIFMANEEFPFSSRGTAAADKQFTFRLPPEKVSMFQELGIDIVTLANNHALDFGTDALLDTCSTLDDAGILRVGAGANLDEAKKPVFMEVKGRRIGFLGASRVIPEGSWNATSKGPGMLTTYDPALLLEEIRTARESCDYLVVYVHWGIERDERPQEYQRTLGQQYIDAGADLVVGSHPHVMQGLEYYRGKPIVYSLGNFVFGSSIPKTALLEVEWDGENALLRLVPGTSSGGYTRMLTDQGEKAGFYQYITSISYGVTVGEDGIVVPGEDGAAGLEESGA